MPSTSIVLDSSIKQKRISNLLVVVCVVFIFTAAISHLTARWVGFDKAKATYRRIGPISGPQIFCAGSSLLQFGLDWQNVSDRFGRGVENWGVGNSSPEIWEISQQLATNSDLMIIGLSVYDLNEYHLCDSRASLVPLRQSIQDFWAAKEDWQFTKRVLSQYPLAWTQILFPTAGKSDAVLVVLRRKGLALLGAAPTADDQGNALVLPNKPILNFGASTEKLSDWADAKKLRRLAMQRNGIQGRHEFAGPKSRALARMLDYAQQRGQVIMVVMPVAPSYANEFLTTAVLKNFEESIAAAKRTAPNATIVRLDRISALQSDQYFSDLVHLNGAGRQIASDAFFAELNLHSAIK